MKKALMLSVVAGAMMSANALANPATVNFNGAVVAPTCTLTADSISRTVAMNDITTVSINQTPPNSAQTANAHANVLPGAITPVPAINFEKCPASVTKVYVAQFTPSGRPDNDVGYTSRTIPESGTGKGISLGLAFVPNAGGNDTLCGSTVSTTRCEDPATVYFPVENGSASTGNRGKVYAYNAYIIPESQTLAGSYSTTFTLAFDWM
ncbi:fimbrial protein, partial [Enterobacter mori]|uniref:fimbrial protein n=1 Tax=Enterobacter mori TaxID=539813 RepID=UPI003B84336E